MNRLLPALGIVALVACVLWIGAIMDKHHTPAPRFCPYGCMTGK